MAPEAGGPDAATAELEVLRGDLARTILDHLPDGVDVVYGDTIDDVADGPDDIAITTATGRSLRADLLVIAEGVRSDTRDRLFGDAVDRNELGITMVFGTIPRTPSDDDRWRWYTTVGGRQIHLRPDNHGTTRAILAYARGEDLTVLDRPQALATLRERYADAGWCVTPMGGGGASLALTAGYVLAAFLTSEPDRPAALAAYEAWMRPLVDDVQKLPPGIEHFAYPQTRVGLAVRGLVDRALTSRLFAPIAAKLTQVADTDRPLPEISAA